MGSLQGDFEVQSLQLLQQSEQRLFVTPTLR